MGASDFSALGKLFEFRRTLSLTLKQMLSVDLVARTLKDEFPPVAIYGLTGRGHRLAVALR